MTMRRVLQVMIGIVSAVCTAVAFFPILMIVPPFVAVGIIVFVLGGTCAFVVTAQGIRHALGRFLVTLGSALVFVPILILLLATIPSGASAEESAKADKYSFSFQPSRWQLLAACLAFGAGSLVSIAGLVTVSSVRRTSAVELDGVPAARKANATLFRQRVSPGVAKGRSAADPARDLQQREGLQDLKEATAVERLARLSLPAGTLRAGAEMKSVMPRAGWAQTTSRTTSAFPTSRMQPTSRVASIGLSREYVNKNSSQLERGAAKYALPAGKVAPQPVYTSLWRPVQPLSARAWGHADANRASSWQVQRVPGIARPWKPGPFAGT